VEVASGHLEYEQADADALSAVSTRPLAGLWHEAAHLPIEQMAKVKLVINFRPRRQGHRITQIHPVPPFIPSRARVRCGACVTNAPSEYDGAQLYER
jgi:hypothetical protein